MNVEEKLTKLNESIGSKSLIPHTIEEGSLGVVPYVHLQQALVI